MFLALFATTLLTLGPTADRAIAAGLTPSGGPWIAVVRPEAGGPGPISAAFDGVVARPIRVDRMPARGGGELMVVQLGGATPGGTSREVALGWADGGRVVAVAGPAPGWWTGPSQYEFPLRVVGIEEADGGSGRTRLRLYNESGRSKPEAEVIRVRVDDRDLTGQSVLPAGPLPADRGRFGEDERSLVVPIRWSDSGAATVAIDYRMLADRYESAATTGANGAGPRPIRTLIVGLRRDLELPIGVSGGPDLAGAICLHHGGLRPELPRTALRARAARAREAAPGRPIYARFAERTASTSIEALADTLDFAVVAPPLWDHEGTGWRLSEAETFWAGLTGRVVVGSLYLPELPGVDGRALHAWALGAIAGGSRGLIWTSAPGVDRARWAAWLVGLGRWIGAGRPAPIVVEADAPGVRVAALLAGPDDLALIVTNEWTSLTPGALWRPFRAVPRRSVGLTLTLGSRPGPIAAEWTEAGQALRTTPVGDGRWRIDLPELEEGALVRVRLSGTEGSTDGPRPTPAVTGAVAASIEPAGSPFLQLGSVEANVPARFRVGIANRGASPRRVGLGASPRFAAEPIAVPAGGSAELTATWLVPATIGPATDEVTVRDEADGAPLFVVTVDGMAAVGASASPPAIDFGRLVAGGTAVEREVRLDRAGTPARLDSATFEPADPRLSARAMGARTGVVLVRLDPTAPGPVRSAARLKLGLAGGGEARLGLSGEVVEAVRLRPSRLVLGPDQAARREVEVSGDEPIHLSKVGDDAPGLTVEGDLGVWGKSLRVAISREAGPDRPDRVDLWCRTESGRESRLSIPIRWVTLGTTTVRATATTTTTDRASGSAQVDGLIGRVDRLIGRLRAEPLAEPAPNWVLGHTLLFFAPSRSRTAEESAEFDRRVGRFLRLADAEGRGGALTLYRGEPEFVRKAELFDRQHHQAQFLHLLSMAGVPLETPLNLPGRPRTLGEIYRGWRGTIRPDDELSWVVSALVSYQEPGTAWDDRFGRPHRLGPLAEGLRDRPEITCDQAHMASALARLLARPAWKADPTVGPLWPEAERFVAAKVAALRSKQSAEGTFPILPEIMEGDYRLSKPGRSRSLAIHYSGHHLEWMTIALDRRGLGEDWILRVVARLLDDIEAEYPGGTYFDRLETVEERFTAGFLTHAASGLSRWRDGVGRASP